MAFDPLVLDLVGEALADARSRREQELSRRASLQAVPDASAG
jgi:hypothetical protein